MTHPRVGTYSSLRGDGFPLKESGVLQQDRIDKLARWDDVILDLACAAAHPDIVAALRAANPSIRLHAYQVMATWNNPNGPQMFIDIWNAVNGTGGLLTVAPEGVPNINVAMPATMYALAEIIKRYAVGWDGIFIDVLIPRPGSADGFNWRGMGFQSGTAFLDSWEANAKEFIRRLAPATSNYGIGFPGVAQGNVTESFHALKDGTWNGNMVQWGYEPGVLKLGFDAPWICSEPLGLATGKSDPLNPENLRRHRYGLGSALLAGGFHSFGRYESDVQWCVDRLDFWFPEYSHPQRGKGWLGEPTEPVPVKPSPSDRYIWMRSFEHGLVVVNTDQNQPHSVYLPARYRPIGGVAKDGWNIPARDALILEAV